MINTFSNDVLSNKSLLDLSLEFASSREKLKDLKLNQKKHLIGCMVPNVELICAAKGYPVYPMRMEPFGNQNLLKILDLGKNILGSGLFTNIIQVVRQFDNSNSIDKILHDIIDAVFSQFDNMYNFGVEKGVPSDECYGIKVLHGMYAHKGKNLSSALFQSIRCSAFEKCYESCVKYAPGIFIDVPPYDNEYSHELAVKEVYHAANELEKVTGHKITNSDLRNIAEITNSCKDYFEKILNIALGDKYPIEPYTFSEIIALLDICFQDFLSNPQRFKNILKNIVIEMEDKIKKGKYLDLSKSPKILFTTRYGGWDHIVGDYICSNGGRVIYADWFMYGFMNRIKTTGDMFENYATFLQFQGMGFGRDNKELVEHTLDFVLKNNIDAVIYNQLFGCHSLTTAYSRLRKALLKEEIPSTLVSFNNVGENREQTKTRCIALMELLK